MAGLNNENHDYNVENCDYDDAFVHVRYGRRVTASS